MSYDFCEVCHHNVFNMEKHIRTEAHKRALRSIALGGLKRPSVPMRSRIRKRDVHIRKG